MSMVKAMCPETADSNDPGKAVGKDGWKDWDVRRVSLMMRISSLSEKPVRHYARRLADWINPAGSRKVHSLVDKVYKMRNRSCEPCRTHTVSRPRPLGRFL